MSHGHNPTSWPSLSVSTIGGVPYGKKVGAMETLRVPNRPGKEDCLLAGCEPRLETPPGSIRIRS